MTTPADPVPSQAGAATVTPTVQPTEAPATATPMATPTVLSCEGLAVQRGLLRAEDLEEALLLRALAARAQAETPPLARVLVENGYLTDTQVRALEDERAVRLRAALAGDLPAEVRAALDAGAQPFGHFVRVRLLGRGGLGEVWLAWDLALGRFVAVKFLLSFRPEPESLRRFLREARLLARLRHPQIVPVYEVGADYLVMQYIEGKTLDQAGLGVAELLPLFVQVCGAVEHAHREGIVHRDLKPQNVMVERAPAGGGGGAGAAHAWVLDFGIAKDLFLRETTTRTGVVIGTPAYMAPEQVRGRLGEVGPATDVYSLGATFYEALTGRLPFACDDLYDLVRRVQDEEPVPPRRVNPQVGADLDAVIRKAMEKDPARRYPTPATLAEELERVHRGEPVTARAPGLVRRFSRWSRRHRTGVVAATAAGLTGLIVGGTGAFLAWNGMIGKGSKQDLRQQAGAYGQQVKGGQPQEQQTYQTAIPFDQLQQDSQAGVQQRKAPWQNKPPQGKQRQKEEPAAQPPGQPPAQEPAGQGGEPSREPSAPDQAEPKGVK